MQNLYPYFRKGVKLYIIAAAIAVAFTLIIGSAHADISNPHPLPPSTSVTATMLKAGAVTPAKLSSGSLFTFTGASPNSIIANGIEATSSFQAPASTTFNGVHYAWPSTGGLKGEVIQTDGSGNLSFVNPASNALTA